jgi:NAD(P)-dependent dehydrogenase (short-subunit alcohol dehydrogenase family)
MSQNRRYVLITGASSGIGRQIAIGLSDTYNVILNGRCLERLEQTRKECHRSSKKIIFVKDLNEIQDLEQSLMAFISGNKIEISYFVHCAGIMKLLPLKILTYEMILSVLSTNLISAALLMKVLVNRKSNNAALKSAVMISSNVSNFGAKAFSIYGASKAGLDGLMRCLAVELAPGVRVNSVLPGAIRTEMTETIYSDQDTAKRLDIAYPLGPGDTTDIFSAVRFLLSDQARWITGQQIIVDGGRTINLTA